LERGGAALKVDEEPCMGSQIISSRRKKKSRGKFREAKSSRGTVSIKKGNVYTSGCRGDWKGYHPDGEGGGRTDREGQWELTRKCLSQKGMFWVGFENQAVGGSGRVLPGKGLLVVEKSSRGKKRKKFRQFYRCAKFACSN